MTGVRYRIKVDTTNYFRLVTNCIKKVVLAGTMVKFLRCVWAVYDIFRSQFRKQLVFNYQD